MAMIEQLKGEIDAGKMALLCVPMSRYGPRYLDTEIRIFKEAQGYVYQLSYPRQQDQPQPAYYQDWGALLERLGGVLLGSDEWQIGRKE